MAANLRNWQRLVSNYLSNEFQPANIFLMYLRLRRAITIVILYKEGKVDYLFLKSYRPIALENTLSKILEKVIVKYIVDIAKEYALLL